MPQSWVSAPIANLEVIEIPSFWRGGYPIPHAAGTENGQRSREE
jgi:hypothetical protein